MGDTSTVPSAPGTRVRISESSRNRLAASSTSSSSIRTRAVASSRAPASVTTRRARVLHSSHSCAATISGPLRGGVAGAARSGAGLRGAGRLLAVLGWGDAAVVVALLLLRAGAGLAGPGLRGPALVVVGGRPGGRAGQAERGGRAERAGDAEADDGGLDPAGDAEAVA